MGKIWIKSPDPSKQCCGCEGKQGPCGSCSACTGIYYNTATNGFGPFSSALGHLPFQATNCKVAQTEDDSYNITSNQINLQISADGAGPRSNALAISAKSGNILNFTINSSASADTHIAQWLKVGTPSYNLYFDTYSGYSLSFNIYQGDSTNWGTVLESNNLPELEVGKILNGSSAGVVSSNVNFVGIGGLIPSGLVPASQEDYPFSYNLVKSYPVDSTLPTAFFAPTGASNYYNPPFCDTNSLVIEDGQNTLLSPATGRLFQYVESEEIVRECETWTLYFRCGPPALFEPQPGRWRSFKTIPEEIRTEEAECFSQFILDNKQLAESLSDGNRFLCERFGQTTDDSTNQLFLDGIAYLNGANTPLNGMLCGPSNFSAETSIVVTRKIYLYYSTEWPQQTIPSNSQTRSVKIQLNKDVCLNVLVGNGGKVTGAGLLPTEVYQVSTGYFNQSANIDINLVAGSLSVPNIFFYTGQLKKENEVNCPFVLP